MPIIKKNDVAPERPVIIVLYGTPGSGKTSVATTAENPLLIDTDRGFDRATQRVDTLTANTWADIETAKADMASYKTVVVDTAKACLDDYLADHVINLNYKLKTNTIKRFGEMADQFKAFVNDLRKNGSDIVFVCHDKETAEGDVIRHAPDCTGQSKDLLLRIADQVGYLSVINKQRCISFEPTDRIVGKNVAQLPLMVVPDAATPEFHSFMASVIRSVKESIHSKSEAQRAANELLEKLRTQLAKVETDDEAAALMTACKELPQILKQPFFKEIMTALTAKGFTYDAGKFSLPQPKDEPQEKKKTSKKTADGK